MGQGHFNDALHLEGQDGQAKDDAEEDEEEDLRDHAGVEGEQGEREDLVEDDSVNDCEDAEGEELTCITLILLQDLRVSCLVLTSLSV